MSEGEAVALILEEMRNRNPVIYSSFRLNAKYPGSTMTCDLVCDGDPLAVEVKMARPNGDNGKPDDTSIKDILSPYEADRSAVSDCGKLARASFGGRRAILIYGFEDLYGRRPLEVIINAFEILADAKLETLRTSLGERKFAAFSGLVHPVHQGGGVFAWEIRGRRDSER